MAQKGILDLRNVRLETQPVRLNGEWKWYWQQLRTPGAPETRFEYTPFPRLWSRSTWLGKSLSSYGYATYSLTILLPRHSQPLALLVPDAYTSYRLYVNGTEFCRSGLPGTSKQATTPFWSSQLRTLPAVGDSLKLLLQVANFEHSKGGPYKEIRLGLRDQLRLTQEQDRALDFFLAGCLFMGGLFFLGLYLFGQNDASILYFSLFCILYSYRIVGTDQYALHSLFPGLNWNVTLHLEYLTLFLGGAMFALYTRSLYPQDAHSLFMKTLAWICFGFTAMTVLFPPRLFTHLIPPFLWLMVVYIGYSTYVYWIAAKNRRPGAEYAVMSTGVLAIVIILITLKYLGLAQPPKAVLFSGYALFFFLQSLILSFRFAFTLKKAKEQAEVNLEVRSEFLSTISHEIRTPLSLIILPVEQLLQAASSGPSIATAQLRKTLPAVLRNARHLLQLINQLLDLSKLEAGRMNVSETKGDIGVFIGELVESFRLVAEGKGVELIFEAGVCPDEVVFDSDKLEKITYNLLSNALKFTPPGGTVRAGLQCEASDADSTQLRLVIADTGTGIPPDKLPFIFDRFYQVDNSLTRSSSGTGIGLALVQELTQLMKGRIQVESEVGQGTTFTLELPLRRAEPTPVSVPEPPVRVEVKETPDLLPADDEVPASDPNGEEAGRKPVILLVEDNQELRSFMTQGLSGPFRILTAADGFSGWELCRSELPDLVISDIMMPRMSGYKLCRMIKENPLTSHIAVVLLTAKSAMESKIEGLSAGANDYLTKPFHYDELLLRVNSLLTYQNVLREYHRRQLSQPGPSQEAKQVENDFLRKVYQTLESHLDNIHLSVEDVATEVAMSSRTLNRKLFSLTGMTAHEVIRHYRLKKAAELLQEGYNISQTAYQIGFNNASYFTRIFKEHYGFTPSQYVQGYKNSDQ
ncbi:ATP-binding protein [Larkinella soli]|uniref:ATP-binding protein n=1 Tax=Larkinella soli TaxID=1770527 RepID=UPI0013E37DB4|nr:ATP-binding protein [Larkinella soli]